jgi:hypothetical protein
MLGAFVYSTGAKYAIALSFHFLPEVGLGGVCSRERRC